MKTAFRAIGLAVMLLAATVSAWAYQPYTPTQFLNALNHTRDVCDEFAQLNVNTAEGRARAKQLAAELEVFIGRTAKSLNIARPGHTTRPGRCICPGFLTAQASAFKTYASSAGECINGSSSGTDFAIDCISGSNTIKALDDRLDTMCFLAEIDKPAVPFE